MQNEYPTRRSTRALTRRTDRALVARVIVATTMTAMAVAAMLFMAAPAHAQAVRKCTIDGRVVFQASACPMDHAAPAVAPKAAVAADLPAAPKKRSLADVLRDRDSAEASRGPIREFKSDGADVLRARMGAV